MHHPDRAPRTDAKLLRDVVEHVAREHTSTADVIADLGEIESRGLHRSLGFSSMFVYCVDALRYSEDAAYKRIQVARAARKFPAVLRALSEGRLHLTGAGLLAPHLTPENVEELLDAATHARKAAIEKFLARRFPRMEALLAASPPAIRPADPVTVPQLAPAQVATPAPAADPGEAIAPSTVAAEEPEAVGSCPLPGVLYTVRATIGEATNEKLERARSYLRHSIPGGDFGAVLDRALDALLVELERKKCAATARPNRRARPSTSKRHVPAAVKRAVWRRDGGCCTFVGNDGRRCGSRDFLEYDHVIPVARGGRATVDKVRIRCRAHNDLEAERVFGAPFMARKRAARTAARAFPSSAPGSRAP